MEYYVYIVKCSDDTLYTGITTDIDRRIDEHNGMRPGGARYTKARRPVELMYTAKFPDRSSASKEEARIKKMPRKDKMIIIENKTRKA